MSTALPAVELPPVCLSLLRRGSALLVFMTDSNAVQRFESHEVAFDTLEAACSVVRSRGPAADAAAHALFTQLIPEQIGSELRRVCSRTLILQLAPELDGVPWEMLSDGVQRLGDRFALMRSVVRPDAGAALRRLEPRPVLDLLRFLPGGQPENAGSTTAGAHVRCRDMVITHATPRDLAIAALHANAVHCVGSADWASVVAQWPEGTADNELRLLAAAVPDTAEALALAHQAGRLGAALVVLLAHGPVDRDAGWFDAVVDALATGCTVAEAGRRVRSACRTGGRRTEELRVYGHGDTALVAAGAASAGVDHLRQVTVVSFDLVRSTDLLRQLGEERYSHVVAQFHERCATVIGHYGGAADDPHCNDGVMCYFGFPVAQEGSARRAIRAGLELARTVADLGLRVRVGIATGRVAIQRGQPWGLVIHLAARLQSIAEPGTVVISAATHALVREWFETSAFEVEAARLQGIGEPQTLYRVEHEIDGTPDRFERGPRPTPFIGREPELDTLLDLWSRSKRGCGEVALVSGEAGIGKSRLVRELRLRLQGDGDDVLVATCNEESMTSAFSTVRETLVRLVGLDAGEGTAAGLDKIARRMPAALARRDPDAAVVVADLLGLALENDVGSGPERRRQRTLETLLGWFCAAAEHKPLCLLVDDVQWVDPSTREFLDRLIERANRLPLLVLMVVRSEDDPGWRPSVPWHGIELRGLPESTAWDLIRQACGEARLPEGVVRLLAARGDGVPLFLEESARMALEMGAASSVGRDTLGLHVPATIQDVLMMRLDRLGPSKLVAQLGAVLGREFPATLFFAVLEATGSALRIVDASAGLDALQRAGLLVRSGAAQGSTFRFKHALVRDVAYQSIWERDRRIIHDAVANVLSARFVELARQRPELLAYHQASAGRHAEALESWESAARLAASRSAHLEAVSHAQDALALIERLPPGAARDRAEMRLQVLLASRLIAIEGYGAEHVEQVYLRAAALSDALGDAATRAKIDLGLEGYYFMRADFDRARAIAQRAVESTAGALDPMQRLQALWAVANVEWHQGNLVTAIELMDRCLAIYRPEFHRPAALQDPGVMCLCYSSWAYWERGDAVEALERVRRVLTLVRVLEHRFSAGEAHGFAASVHMFLGEYPTALAYAEEAVRICEEAGFAVWLAHARMMRGRLMVQLGDVTAGLAEMERAYAMWIKTGAVVTRPLYLTLRAEGHLLAGQPEHAAPLLKEAQAVADRGGEHYHSAEILRLRAEVLARTDRSGAPHEALRLARAAHRRAREQGKRAFVLRAAITLARLGGRETGLSRLRSALADLPAAVDTEDYRAAERLLRSDGPSLLPQTIVSKPT